MAALCRNSRSVIYALSIAVNKSTIVQDELLELKNLGKTSVRWLHAIGVHRRDQLAEKGPVTVYKAVRARGFKANRVLLYALQGALMDVHWSELDPQLKSQLLAQAENQPTG